MLQPLQKSMNDARNQQYIPGLNRRPNDIPLEEKEVTRKKIPPELVEEFKNGAKHPVSAIMEYAAMQRVDIQFDEVGVDVPNLTSKFAYVCKISGVLYQQGVGKTKKEAKTNAAKYAFISILGLDGDTPENGK